MTSGGSANGVVAQAMLYSSADQAGVNGYVFKRDDTSWGVNQPYLHGQAFAVLSPSGQAASDTAGDYGGLSGPGHNPGLFRVDAFGGVGSVQGMHLAPGLRDTYGGPPAIGLWVQLGSGVIDTPGVIVTMPPAASNMKSPAIAVENAAGHVLAEVNAGGAWVSRVASAGIVLVDTVTGHFIRYVSVGGRLVGHDLGTAVPLT